MGAKPRLFPSGKEKQTPSLAFESSKVLEAKGHLSASGTSIPPSAHPPPGVGGPGPPRRETPGGADGRRSQLGSSQPPPLGVTPELPAGPPSSASDPPAAVLLGTFLGAFSFPRLAATAASHHLEA